MSKNIIKNEKKVNQFIEKHHGKLMGLGICLLGLGALGFAIAFGISTADNQGLATQKAKFEKDFASAQTEVEQLQTQVVSIEELIADYESRLETKEAEKKSLEEALARKEISNRENIFSLQAEINQVRRELVSAKALLAEVRAAKDSVENRWDFSARRISEAMEYIANQLSLDSLSHTISKPTNAVDTLPASNLMNTQRQIWIGSQELGIEHVVTLDFFNGKAIWPFVEIVHELKMQMSPASNPQARVPCVPVTRETAYTQKEYPFQHDGLNYRLTVVYDNQGLSTNSWVVDNSGTRIVFPGYRSEDAIQKDEAFFLNWINRINSQTEETILSVETRQSQGAGPMRAYVIREGETVRVDTEDNFAPHAPFPVSEGWIEIGNQDDSAIEYVRLNPSFLKVRILFSDATRTQIVQFTMGNVNGGEPTYHSINDGYDGVLTIPEIYKFVSEAYSLDTVKPVIIDQGPLNPLEVDETPIVELPRPEVVDLPVENLPTPPVVETPNLNEEQINYELNKADWEEWWTAFVTKASELDLVIGAKLNGESENPSWVFAPPAVSISSADGSLRTLLNLMVLEFDAQHRLSKLGFGFSGETIEVALSQPLSASELPSVELISEWTQEILAFIIDDVLTVDFKNASLLELLSIVGKTNAVMEKYGEKLQEFPNFRAVLNSLIWNYWNQYQATALGLAPEGNRGMFKDTLESWITTLVGASTDAEQAQGTQQSKSAEELKALEVFTDVLEGKMKKPLIYLFEEGILWFNAQGTTSDGFAFERVSIAVFDYFGTLDGYQIRVWKTALPLNTVNDEWQIINDSSDKRLVVKAIERTNPLSNVQQHSIDDEAHIIQHGVVRGIRGLLDSLNNKEGGSDK